MTVVAKCDVLRTFASILSATEALTLFLKWRGGSLARVALFSSGTGDDPCGEGIAVSATMPVSDGRPGEDGARKVFFGIPGMIALISQSSGSPPLALPLPMFKTLPAVSSIHCPSAGGWCSRPITLSGTANAREGSRVRGKEAWVNVTSHLPAFQGSRSWSHTYDWTLLLGVERPSRPPRSANRITKSIASMTMAVLILERPTWRSAKRMGNSATRPPSRST